MGTDDGAPVLAYTKRKSLRLTIQLYIAGPPQTGMADLRFGSGIASTQADPFYLETFFQLPAES